jgi:hypothetical protein
MELEELKRLLTIDAKAVLSREVPPLGTEYDIVLHELSKIRTLNISNRTIEIPGLTRNLGLICQVLAEFKDKEKRNVMPLQYAKSDDIVLMQLRPEHIDADLVWEQDVAIAAGEFTDDFHIIPRVAGSFTIPNKQIFIITDIIELYSPPSFTGVRVVDVDGVPQYAIDASLAIKASDLQIFEFPHPVIADATIDIDGKVESKTAGATVTTAATPIGVWIGFGKDVPALFRQ